MNIPEECGTASALQALQAWYAAHCDGDWEHHNGIDIHSLDNPGWTLNVDLTGTELADAPFEELTENPEDESAWLICSKRGAKFTGSGGAGQLERLIHLFLAWAASASRRSA